MTERYVLVTDDEYCYTLDTQSENYKTIEDFEKQEFEDAKKEGIDIEEYEDDILEAASDKYWEWVYDNYLDADVCNDIMNTFYEKNQQLSKDKQLAEAELITYKQRVKDELEMRYCLSNHKPVFEFMAKELDITLEGNVE